MQISIHEFSLQISQHEKESKPDYQLFTLGNIVKKGSKYKKILIIDTYYFT